MKPNHPLGNTVKVEIFAWNLKSLWLVGAWIMAALTLSVVAADDGEILLIGDRKSKNSMPPCGVKLEKCW